MFIEILDKKREGQYEDFLLKGRATQLYASNKYRKLLKNFLGAEDRYLLAIDTDGRIAGALPSFLMRNRRLGNVLNSLPFYGSNGAIIAHESGSEAREMLLEAFYSLAEKENCVSATIITSPFEKDNGFYESRTQYSHKDERVGQLTRLPMETGLITDSLMARFDSAGRRNIRKAETSGITVKDGASAGELDFLIRAHTENMRSTNGIPKPERFFRSIQEFFDHGKDYRIFTAYKEREPAASLLVFYFNKTVEYFTPAIAEAYRTCQPLSIVIFEAMKDAAARGYEWWNWGGTWKDQEGLYRFKKKWDAGDSRYFYYTRVYDENILNCSKEKLLEEYPYFYIYPYGSLVAAR